MAMGAMVEGSGGEELTAHLLSEQDFFFLDKTRKQKALFF